MRCHNASVDCDLEEGQDFFQSIFIFFVSIGFLWKQWWLHDSFPWTDPSDPHTFHSFSANDLELSYLNEGGTLWLPTRQVTIFFFTIVHI